MRDMLAKQGLVLHMIVPSGCKKLMDRNWMQRRETFLTLSFVGFSVRPFAAKILRERADAKNFQKLDRDEAIHFLKKSSKSELSSQFLVRSKFENFARHFLANSADRPRILANLITIRPNPGTIG